jgi:hypothetical protein
MPPRCELIMTQNADFSSESRLKRPEKVLKNPLHLIEKRIF